MHGNVHKKTVALRCINNQFRIESLTSESESSHEVPRDSNPQSAPNIQISQAVNKTWWNHPFNSSIVWQLDFSSKEIIQVPISMDINQYTDAWAHWIHICSEVKIDHYYVWWGRKWKISVWQCNVWFLRCTLIRTGSCGITDMQI